MIPINNVFILLSIIFVSLTTQLPAQTKITNHLGERLKYKLKFLKLPAGSINFDVMAVEKIDSNNTYHLIVRAQTNNMFSPLFMIQNVYESFFDTSTFLPLVLKKDIKQKNINHRLTIDFNHVQNVASISDSISWSIPDSCFSFFSMIYFLRNQTYIQGDTIRFYLDSENSPSEGKATFTGEEILSVPVGKFESIKVSLQFKLLTSTQRPWKTDLLTNRLANPGSKITIWFSNDINRLPLIIKFNQKHFNIEMILEHFKLAHN